MQSHRFWCYHNFPASLCISVNEEVVNGIPGKRVIKENDLVSVDCGVYMNGFHGDSAYTFALAEINDDARKLCFITMQCLNESVKIAKPNQGRGH